MVPYALICMTRYGVRWNTGRRKRRPKIRAEKVRRQNGKRSAPEEKRKNGKKSGDHAKILKKKRKDSDSTKILKIRPLLPPREPPRESAPAGASDRLAPG